MNLLAANLDMLIALSAAVAVVAAVFVVAWPYFVRDHLTERMVQVTNESERIRVRERNRLNAQSKQISLRTEPKRLYKLIVDRLNLAGTENGETVKMLRMAGYRGEGPITAYLAIRQLAPVGMFVLAALYVFVILHLDYPLFVKLADSHGGSRPRLLRTSDLPEEQDREASVLDPPLMAGCPRSSAHLRGERHGHRRRASQGLGRNRVAVC